MRLIVTGKHLGRIGGPHGRRNACVYSRRASIHSVLACRLRNARTDTSIPEKIVTELASELPDLLGNRVDGSVTWDVPVVVDPSRAVRRKPRGSRRLPRLDAKRRLGLGGLPDRPAGLQGRAARRGGRERGATGFRWAEARSPRPPSRTWQARCSVERWGFSAAWRPFSPPCWS